jgi:hypothetical protein
MDEEFDSLIVTDPDLVDPGIDVSGLRTQTDTSLLGNIPDFAGIQYEAFNPNRLSDLMRLYSTGLPMIDTAQVPGAIDTLVDVGGGDGMDQVTGDSMLDAPTDVLTQSGTFGGQPTFTTIPGTTVDDITGDITNPDGTYGGNIVDEVALTGGQPTTPTDTSIAIEDFTTPFVTERGITGGPVEYRDQTQITDPVTLIEDLPMVQTSTDAQGNIYSMREEDYGSYLGNINDEVALTGIATPEQQEGFLQNVLGQAGQTVSGALTQLGKIPGAIVDIANQTVDVFGKKLNVGKTLASLAVNKLVGAPVSLVFDAAKEFLPEGNIAPSTNTARNTGLLQGDNTVTQDIYGINTQTSFDPVKSTTNYNDYNVEQVAKLENVLDDLKNNKYKGDEQSYLDNTKRLRQELEDRKEYLEAINKDPLYGGDIQDTGDASIAEQIAEQNRITGDLPGGGNIYDEFAPSDDKDDSPASSTPSVNEADVEAGLGTESISDFVDDFEVSGEAAPITGVSGADSFFDAVDTATGGGGDRDDDSGPSAPTGPPSGGFQSESTYDAEAEDETADDRGGGNGGDDGGGGGGCCFIMLEARYGNGTMDKVVRRYRDENMTPRNRRGYHKVAEVLVPLMRKSKIFKWIVTKTFADPLVSYGKWYYGENKHGWIFAPVKSAWLKLFDVVGTDTVFIRENGEEV